MTAPGRMPPPSRRLGDAAILLFGGGAASGRTSIGQATAIAYAAAGARVAVVDRHADRAQTTRDRIVANGGTAIALTAEIRDRGEVEQAIAATARAFGRIDVLHNNVGVPTAKAFDEYDEADWHEAMAVNCIGAATSIRLTLPHLVASRGAIVNVSSVAAIRHTGMDYATYSASKAALDQLTVAVAIEYARRGVRANAVLPGLIDTDLGRGLMTHSADPAVSRARRSPTGAQGDVWDVANAAVFLASPEARYVNGHLLVVDGGLSARC